MSNYYNLNNKEDLLYFLKEHRHYDNYVGAKENYIKILFDNHKKYKLIYKEFSNDDLFNYEICMDFSFRMTQMFPAEVENNFHKAYSDLGIQFKDLFFKGLYRKHIVDTTKISMVLKVLLEQENLNYVSFDTSLGKRIVCLWKEI